MWYDPEQAYGEVVDQLALPGTTVLRYQGSFFELRHRMEPFLEFVDDEGRLGANVEAPPRLLVYVPLDPARTQHALIEAEAAGAVIEPGGSPWQRNTRLKVLAAARIAPELKTIRKDPKALLDAYTQGIAGKGGEEALP